MVEIGIAKNEFEMERLVMLENGDVEVVFDDGPADGVVKIKRKNFEAFIKDYTENLPRIKPEHCENLHEDM